MAHAPFDVSSPTQAACTDAPARDSARRSRTSPPRPLDVVVIGAGIGGLTAGALAAHRGLSTVVVEAHNRPGGCAGDFALDGVLFPAGATLVSGFEPGGLHTWTYDHLGISHRAQPLAMAMEVITAEQRIPLWTDRRRWAEQRQRAFPGAGAGGERFFRWSERLGTAVHDMAARLPVLPARAPRDVMRLAAALRPDTFTALPYLARTASGVLRSFGADHDADLRQFLDAQLLDATGCTTSDCAAVNAAIAIDLYHHGCFWLPGGTAEIARDLLRALRRDGGAIRYNSRVVALRQGAGGLWQTQLAGGEVISARTVVSNVPAWDMPRLLGSKTPVRLRRTNEPREQAWSAVTLHVAVDPAALPPEPFASFQVLPEHGESLAECGMSFVTVMPPSRRPGAPRAVSISTHTEAGPWWQLPPQAYEERKRIYEERLLAACERAIPGFRAGVRFYRTATPRTFAAYTGRGLGLVGGVRTSVRNALFGALSHRSGLPGLYLCGDSVFPGQGTIGVTLSGINAWRSVCDQLGAREPRHQRRTFDLTYKTTLPTSPYLENASIH